MFPRARRAYMMTSSLLSRPAAALALNIAAISLAMGAAQPAFSQDYSSGSLAGRVVAGSKAVAGASVTITSVSQGVSRTLVTDANGAFQAPIIPIGSYRITVSRKGFETSVSTQDVHLGGVSAFTFPLEPEGSVEAVVVKAKPRPDLDFAVTTTGRTVNLAETVKELPIARNVQAVALLAPTVALGSSGQNSVFGGQPSVGGASVAENAFYVNGLNITDFNKYIGGSSVPFDFYQTVEVKTGGYPAEFGRADGGIVNAVTKSGSNTPMVGVHLNWAPAALTGTSPDTYRDANSRRRETTSDESIEAGGAIVPDRLFFYGLLDLRQHETKTASITSTAYNVDKDTDPFWGAKLDGYITSRHHFEFTAFNTGSTISRSTRNFDYATGTLSGTPQPTQFRKGGLSYIGRYTGNLTDFLTLSVAYGDTKQKDSTLPNAGKPLVIDERSGTPITISDQKYSSLDVQNTERKFVRADVDLFFNVMGRHHVRFGYDREETSLEHNQPTTGAPVGGLPSGSTFTYLTAGASDQFGVAQGTNYVDITHYYIAGRFSGVNEAFYLQDSWDITPRINIQAGVRNDLFHLDGADNKRYAAFNANWAPRLGASWDVTGDRSQKIYATYGRYFLPIASNLAFRGASAATYFDEYYYYSGAPNPTGAPTLGAQISGFPSQSSTGCVAGGYAAVGAPGCVVTSNGTIPPSFGFQAKNAHASYDDEIIGGYEVRFSDAWKAGVSLTYRTLGRALEDAAVDAGVLSYCTAHGIAGCDQLWGGFSQYSYINPGHGVNVTLYTPLPGETTPRTISFSAADLHLPKAKREYTALTFVLSHPFDGKWSFDGSYTLSRSVGNYEGTVNSNIGQTDTASTEDFDQPGLTTGAYGLLPNHHLHELKLFGSYQVLDQLLVGANFQMQSPKHFGCLGVNPVDPFAAAYGAASWYCQGVRTPRGTQFTSDWLTQLDMSFRYTLPTQLAKNAVLRADIFNLFDQQAKTDFDEFGDLNSGAVNPNYRKPLSYQQPRSIRLGLDLAW